MELSELPNRLFAHLRSMDAEAGLVKGRWATGLRGYYEFQQESFSTKLGRPRENVCSDRLAELLTADGWTVEREVGFRDRPKSRERCDLRLEGFGECVWIEVKGAWHRLVNDDYSAGRLNPSFLKHLDAAAHDLDKLRPLLTTHATAIGLLVIGFHTPGTGTFEEHLTRLARVAADWQVDDDRWEDRSYPGFEIVTRFMWQRLQRNRNAF